MPSRVPPVEPGRFTTNVRCRTPTIARDSAARGNDWISFTPKAWDDMSVDRLHAWFRVASKLAAK